MQPKELYDSGMFALNQNKPNEALDCFLDATMKSVETLKKTQDLNFLLLAQNSLEKSKFILYRIHSKRQGGSRETSPESGLVIPISPLKNQMNKLINKKEIAENSYNEALGKSFGADLKRSRKLMEEIETSKIEIMKLTRIINDISEKSIDSWSPQLVGSHLSYLSRNLFSKVNPADIIIPSLDRVSPALSNFFGFQEYIYNVFKVILAKCESGWEQITVDHVANVLYELFYNQHDISTTTTILSVLASQISIAKICSPPQKKIINNLLIMLENNSVEIHSEILSDMVKAHPVNRFDGIIIPYLQVFVEKSITIYEKMPIDDKEIQVLESYISTLKNCQFQIVGMSSEFLPCNDVLHWILSHQYDSKNCTEFWASVLNSASTQSPKILPEMDANIPIVETTETTQYEPEDDPFEDEIFKRLEALQKPRTKID
jgi:hypothetical protein